MYTKYFFLSQVNHVIKRVTQDEIYYFLLIFFFLSFLNFSIYLFFFRKARESEKKLYIQTARGSKFKQKVIFMRTIDI